MGKVLGKMKGCGGYFKGFGLSFSGVGNIWSVEKGDMVWFLF